MSGLRGWLALTRAELMLHGRSTRSRLVVVVYPLATSGPGLLFDRTVAPYLTIGNATALSLISTLLPLTTLLLAAGLAGRGQDRASREELAPLLAGSPFTNSQLVAGRAALLALLFLGATALPFLILAAATWAGGGAPDFVALGGHWLLEAWPMAVVMGWTWLALTLLGGSDLAALMLLGIASLAGDQLASRSGGWETGWSWPFFDRSGRLPFLFGTLLRGAEVIQDRWNLVVGLLASEGPYDPRQALTAAAVDFGPGLGGAVLLLAVATLRLGRCRADLPPRNFSWAPSLGRLRQFLAADGGLGRERLLPLLALLLALASLWLVERRADFFSAWAEDRAAAELREEGDRTSSALTLLGIELAADLGADALLPDGQLESRFEERFRLAGTAPLSHLAFRLNPFLRLASLTASSDGAPRELRVRRRHDRLFVELTAPLLPGAELVLRGELVGRPASPRLGLRPGIATSSFGESWEALRRNPADRRRTRLAAANLRPAVSRNQVRLAGEDLVPIPRFTPWREESAPEENPSNQRAEEDPTPKEDNLAAVPTTFKILAPAAFTLFSSCGDTSLLRDRRSLLEGVCTIRPSELAFRGGELTVVSRAEVTLATLPLHAATALPLLDSLESIHRQSDRAWPGASRLGKIVLIESLPYFDSRAPQLGSSDRLLPITARGQLLEIDERRLVEKNTLDPLELAGPLLVDHLLRRRPLDPDDAWLVAAFLRQVVTRRLGLQPQNAVLSGTDWQRNSYTLPLVAYRNYERLHGSRRLAALVADLEGRVGSGALQLGVQDFLDQQGAPGRMADLIAAIDRRSEQNLERFVADFLDKGGLPELQLDAVRVERRAGEAYRVIGQLRNSRRGEVICPLVLRTDHGDVWGKIRVGDQESVPFELTSPYQPRLLELDPAATCLRFVPGVGGAARERVNL